MSRWQTGLAWGLVVAACVGAALLVPSGEGQAQQRQRVAVESLLPQDPVLYFGWDGMAASKDAWQKTAAYEALYKSGLMETAGEFLKAVIEKASKDPEAGRALGLATALYQEVYENGLSLAVNVSEGAGPPIPYAIAVLHGAASLEPKISALIKEGARDELEFKSRRTMGRQITSAPLPDSPGLEVGWWTEGAHLVLVFGRNAVAASLDVATGKTPNITKGKLWKEYRSGDAEFTVANVGWLDFAALRELYGQMPLPQQPNQNRRLTVNDVLKPLGLQGLGPIVFRSGYKDRALWSEVSIQTTGEREGLLALMDLEPITLKDLPPLPETTSTFMARSFDGTKLYETVLSVARGLSALGPPQVEAQVEGVIQNLPTIAGFDPKEEFFDALGNVACAYSEPTQGVFGFGFGIALSVDDAETLRGTLDHIWSMIGTQLSPEQFDVRTTEKYGRDIVTLRLGGGFLNPSYVVDEKWMVIGLVPQTAETFLLRLDGKLPSWEPSKEWQSSFDTLPDEFVSISTSDPREAVRTFASLAPMVMPMIEQGMRESGVIERGESLPISLADLPPAELVARPLFPNISVCVIEEDGLRCISRQSLPAFPLLGGTDASSVGTVAVLVALLLPAVQQAREAARRTQSKNNLKQTAIALHNYHDTHNKLPTGTIPNEKLKPEKRLSWIVEILPYIEQAALYNQVDKMKAWDARENAQSLKTRIPILLNPSQPAGLNDEYAPTHYVGIAGVGADAPTLPVTSNRAGVFGYNRTVKFNDITDGLSNTMGVTDASEKFGSWGAGGPATIRALTQQPYVNGPDGIGSRHPEGLSVMLMDGSVRFVSENIDPEVFKALATIRGGEAVGGF